jgi:hypothetical protein
MEYLLGKPEALSSNYILPKKKTKTKTKTRVITQG